ncbi:NAP1-binding protein 2 [Neolecta irregularis DAH-3]|uniref:NAP1-binding protein 2 n=1 Tax=Neolecta irregularis (strain DAH-3) TaxID=1198029 RepID=A0A1U7LLH4_NEOID|nr:NAP1-binding protein 2 [Neolecta irregularis DAH-3]|eukprot:OLL23516.1 NAP1-binding protein 2 [Neolecta irregularis DAH-3]
MTTPIFRDYAYPPSHPLHLPHSSSHRSDPNPSNTNDTVLEEDDDLSEDEYPYRRKAIALFDFEPEHETEFALKAGQTMWISHKHGQGWLVAEDIKTGMFTFCRQRIR